MEGALAELERALELDPGLLRARLYYGQALARADRLDEAAEAYLEVLDRDPGHPTAQSRLGELELERGERGLARERFERALERNPVFDRAQLGLGRLALLEGEVQEAGSRARTVLQEEPAHAAAHHLLGLALEERAPDEALWHLELAARFAPDEPSFSQDLERLRASR